MRGLLIVGLSLIALADRAAADDIMVTKAAPIPYSVPAAYDWSGFFAGGHLGYAWGSSNWTGTTPAARALSSSGSIDLFQSFDAFEDTGSYFEGTPSRLQLHAAEPRPHRRRSGRLDPVISQFLNRSRHRRRFNAHLAADRRTELQREHPCFRHRARPHRLRARQLAVLRHWRLCLDL